jgi:hypothetical protein
MAIQRGRPFNSMDHFWRWYHDGLSDEKPRPDHRALNSRAINNLIAVGAMDGIGAEYDGDRGKAEVELIGTYVANDPYDEYAKHIEGFVLDVWNLNKIQNHRTESDVWIGGKVTRKFEHTQKNGQQMCFVSVALDHERNVDVVVFGSTYNKPLKTKIDGVLTEYYIHPETEEIKEWFSGCGYDKWMVRNEIYEGAPVLAKGEWQHDRGSLRAYFVITKSGLEYDMSKKEENLAAV